MDDDGRPDRKGFEDDVTKSLGEQRRHDDRPGAMEQLRQPLAAEEPLELDVGHIGREFYMIEKGEVEVLAKSGAEKADTVIATLGPREVFGERALLEDTERTASVRASCST